MFSDEVVAAAGAVIEAAKRRRLKIATAESCTAGLVSAALTSVPGSAEAFERGFVVYSYGAKVELLGLDPMLVEDTGAVSEMVARAMAEGALTHSDADLAVAITGIAGPTGGTPLKPIGLVHFATSLRGDATVHRRELFGDLGRERVRLAATQVAIDLLLDRLQSLSPGLPDTESRASLEPPKPG